MPGTIRNGLIIVLAWIAISACASELLERRQLVLAMAEEIPSNWVSGAMSNVYEGFDATGN